MLAAWQHLRPGTCRDKQREIIKVLGGQEWVMPITGSANRRTALSMPILISSNHPTHRLMVLKDTLVTESHESSKINLYSCTRHVKSTYDTTIYIMIMPPDHMLPAVFNSPCASCLKPYAVAHHEHVPSSGHAGWRIQKYFQVVQVFRRLCNAILDICTLLHHCANGVNTEQEPTIVHRVLMMPSTKTAQHGTHRVPRKAIARL